jgi:lipopolysaccharide transport system permease protein
MNFNSSVSAAPWVVFLNFWENRGLIFELTKRDVLGRYRGSLLGLAWSFFNPLIMLAVYTFVFSIVFQAKWQIDATDNQVNFAVIIFAGMMVHGLFAECINKSPSLIVNNANFVKKVIFPIDILVWVSMGSALFHFSISLIILLIVQLLFNNEFSSFVILLPVVILPLIFISIGISWVLSSLGVYLRDINQITAVVTMILMFVSPIFFPASAIPEKYQYILTINPLTIFIESTRDVLLFDRMPNWGSIFEAYLISIIVMSAGYWWFQKTRRGFADVL